MEAAPVKPPLHNFRLAFLQWGSKNSVNAHHRFRRPVDSPPPPPSDAEADGGVLYAFGSRTARDRLSAVEKSQYQHHRERDDERRSGDCGVKEETTTEVREDGESSQKSWNLRPRRAPPRGPIEIPGGGGGPRNGEWLEAENAPKAMRLRGSAELQGGGRERREKRKFWIALSKEEIEEDIYSLTGSKPARRPRKRAKNVQKQLDNVFPGSWLVGVCPEAYRSLEAPTKR